MKGNEKISTKMHHKGEKYSFFTIVNTYKSIQNKRVFLIFMSLLYARQSLLITQRTIIKLLLPHFFNYFFLFFHMYL